MFDRLGAMGIAGLLVVLAGIAVIAYVDPLIASGVTLILVGLGATVRALVQRLMASFGMGMA